MDSDEIEDFKSWKGVPGTIILINAFGNSKYNTFSVAHVATCRLIKNYLRLSGPHNVSVCVYGTEESTSSAFDSKSVIEIFPLSMPTLENYKKLRSFDMSSYSEAKELKLSDVLWHCSKTFSNFKKQLSSRTIMMLSELRTPPIDTDHKPTLKKVMDLVDFNVEINIINISNEEYEIDPFYKKFLMQANQVTVFENPVPTWDVNEIEKIMHQESHRHLAIAKLDFEIIDGFSIGVAIYSFIKRSGHKPKQTYLERDTNALVTNVTKTLKVPIKKDTDDGSEEDVAMEVPVLKSEILYYVECGGERVEFTDNEKNQINNPFGSPMIKLLGFKPANILCKEKWYHKISYFLFPNEASVEGSTVTFKALHRACREMSVVAICVLCTRVNSKPVNVALSPTTAPFGLHLEVGFDVIIIPFIESVRDILIETDNENVGVNKPSKLVMTDIVRSMKFDYEPEMFEKPTLQSLYRALESIVLKDEKMDPFNDTTLPNPKIYENIREDLFEETFGPFGITSIKRSATSSATGGGKKTKIEYINEELLTSRINTQKVNLYTVEELKHILKSKDSKELPALTGLKKAELVDLVYKHCS